MEQKDEWLVVFVDQSSRIQVETHQSDQSDQSDKSDKSDNIANEVLANAILTEALGCMDASDMQQQTPKQEGGSNGRSTWAMKPSLLLATVFLAFFHSIGAMLYYFSRYK